MTDTRFDVLCIGNAIFDVLASVEEDFLVAESLTKGSMRLVDAEESLRLYDRIGAAVRIPGGCAGNTASGVASLGGRAAFVGKVAADELGDAYGHDMRGAGIHFATPALKDGAPTARSIILITPDGERTMNTYLGACQELGPADVDPATVEAAAITYLEGYLWDPPAAKEAFRRASGVAHAAGRRVAITLSDSFCVDRWRPEFLSLLRTGTVDTLFANEHELKALYETSDLDSAVAAVREDAKLAVVTLGAAGSMAVTREETHHVRAQPVDKVVDLTGAGDLFASGFLTGLARGLPLADCLRLGGIAAAECIGHVGPRPQAKLAEIARQEGFEL